MHRWLPAALTFLLVVAFDPFIQGAATSPRWALLAPLLFFMEWWALPFVGWCFFRLDFDDAMRWAVLTSVFCWGVRGLDLRSVVWAATAGLVINGALAFVQWYGWSGIPQMAPPAGLFVNKNILGETACLTAALALSFRLWGPAAACVPIIVLSGSRASELALVAALWWVLPSTRWKLWLAASCGLTGVVWLAAWGFPHDPDLAQRLALWRNALPQLSLWGNGSYDFSTVFHRDPHLHNDWLQLVWGLGVVGVVPVLIIASSCERYAPFVLATAVIGTFGFPLEMPVSGFLVAAVCGVAVGNQLAVCGTLVGARMGDAQHGLHAGGSPALPASTIHRARTRSTGRHKRNRALRA